jgi:hypothetical protein
VIHPPTGMDVSDIAVLVPEYVNVEVEYLCDDVGI